MRNPARNAVLWGLVSVTGLVLVVLGVADMHASGRSGSPLLMLGLFPALLAPIGAVHYLSKVRVFRDMQSGRTAIARWTVPADQFSRFCEEDRRSAARSISTNFYEPPRTIPAEGVEVIFADDGVLIGGGYFPLSTDGGRRLERVRYIASDPPAIEFDTVMNAMARTSSATTTTRRIAATLRVPVATGAAKEASEVVRRYEAIIARR